MKQATVILYVQIRCLLVCSIDVHASRVNGTGDISSSSSNLSLHLGQV